MNDVTLKILIVKKRSLLLSFFVLFIPVISSENVFAQKFCIKDYVKIAWNGKKDWMEISATVYDYSLGPNKYQFLYCCRFEFSEDAVNYTKLVEINTPRQNRSKITTMDLFDKLYRASIKFGETVNIPGGGEYWPVNFSNNTVTVTVPDEKNKAVVTFAWCLKYENRNVRYVRISGQWKFEKKNEQNLSVMSFMI